MKFLVALAFVYASEISALIQTNILSNIIKGADELFKKSIDYVGFDPILHEDALLDVPHIITKYGYPFENHTVETKDHYVLSIHRIPFGRVQQRGPIVDSSSRPIVMLQHGFMGSSGDWTILGPRRSLGFILADAGFDVWMINCRGNRYSRENTRISPEDPNFWNFSWQEMGLYDLPAIINHIMRQTHQQRMFHVGHSQGTTALYILLAELPRFNQNIIAHFSFSPVAFMSHTISPVMSLMGVSTAALRPILALVGYNEWLPSSRFLQMAAGAICSVDALASLLCSNILFLMFGFNRAQLNTTTLPIIFGHAPAGAATNQVVHFGQLMYSGRFQYWDFGSPGNTRHYKTPQPPEFKLDNIRVPIYLFIGRNDWVCHPTDVDNLRMRLRYPKAITVPDPNWSHLDPLYGIDAPNIVYPKLIDLMKVREPHKDNLFEDNWLKFD